MSNGISCTVKELYFEGCKVGKQHLHLRRKATAPRGGQKRSSIRGRGMEFFESRPYVAQDEIRNIDWKVSARLNNIYTKIFIEEKNRPIYILLDLRSHMFFGSRVCFKSVLAARISARLSFAAINGGDNLGAFIFTDDNFLEFKPKSTKSGQAKFFQALARVSPSSQKTNINSWTMVLSRVKQAISKGSALFLLSDFFGLDQLSHPWLFALRQKSDIFALKITDPLEQELPKVGIAGLAFADQKIILDTNNSQLQINYKKYISDQTNFENQLFRSLNIPKFNFLTSDNLDRSLRALFSGKW